MSGDAVAGPDGRLRCPWGLSTEDYVAYHDEEWGRPVHGDDALYERLCLEAFQSGLSWITILRRREGFRAAFAGFKIAEVARFTDADRERLLADPGIIRNRAKVDATLANARVLADWSEGSSTNSSGRTRRTRHPARPRVCWPTYRRSRPSPRPCPRS